MAPTKTKFKSPSSEKKWMELHKKREELQSKNSSSSLIEEKINILTSLMTSCKIGFNLSDAKVKKIIKYLKDKTGIKKIKYSVLPEGIKPKTILIKDIVILYVEKDDQILFKENIS